LGSHEPAIEAVKEAGRKLMEETKLGSEDIENRLQQLQCSWEELREISSNR
jgi:PP-loop superfamily ATP-utilizing enzyme